MAANVMVFCLYIMDCCRRGMEANQLLRDNLSSTSSTTLEDIDSAKKDLHSSIECIICYSILFWLIFYNSKSKKVKIMHIIFQVP